MSRSEKIPIVIVALPFYYQDGYDKYDGIMQYLLERGLNWEIKLVRERSKLQKFKSAIQGGVDGALIDVEFVDLLKDFPLGRIPLVTLDMQMDGASGQVVHKLVQVCSDSRAIGREAARHLMAQGNYAAFCYVGVGGGLTWSRERGIAFGREVERHGFCCRYFEFHGVLSGANGNRLASWLKAVRKPAAVLAANDETASEILDICARQGINVPDEMGVLGIDNEMLTCSHSRPTLSSVQPDFREEGYQAAKALDRLLVGKTTRCKIVCRVKNVVARRSTVSPSSSGKLVQLAEEVIAANALSGLRVSDVARELKISRRLLDMRYRQIKGISVLEAIRAIRLDRAKFLLQTTTLSVSDVATQTGFSSPAYFSAVFTKAFGCSPRSWRK